MRNKRWIGEWCEFDEPHAIGEFIDEVCRDLNCEARLAGPTYAGECNDSCAIQDFLDTRHLLLAADETCELNRQIIGLGVEGF